MQMPYNFHNCPPQQNSYPTQFPQQFQANHDSVQKAINSLTNLMGGGPQYNYQSNNMMNTDHNTHNKHHSHIPQNLTVCAGFMMPMNGQCPEYNGVPMTPSNAFLNQKKGY